MTDVSPSPADRQQILHDVINLIQDLSRDWETEFNGGIQPGSRLIADLGFQSVDVVQFIVALEEHYGRRNLPFAELLMRDGRFVDDLSVGETADFLARQLNGCSPGRPLPCHEAPGGLNGHAAAQEVSRVPGTRN